MDSLTPLLRLALLLCALAVSEQGPVHRRLYQHLLQNYSSLELPVQNASHIFPVVFRLHFRQIMDVDEKSQVLTSNVWLQMMWNDSALQWDPEEYPGIDMVQFPDELLWKPDIVLYNSVDEHFGAMFRTKVVVMHGGRCIHIVPAILKSRCKMDVRWFPFDEQRCELTFGSWSYNHWTIELKMLDSDVSEYTPNGEWHLVGVPGVRAKKQYPCGEEPYSEITYAVVIRRRTQYYSLSLLLPCVLISTLALLVFLLPADSGEKITLGLTVLLSLMVVMLLVADIVPATSDTVPLISQYFAAILVIVGLSVIATVLVLHFHHHNPSGSQMPKWTRVFLLDWCAWFLRMQRPGCPDVSAGGLNGKPPSTTATSPESGAMCGRDLHMVDKAPLTPSSAKPELGKVLDEVRYITARFRDQDQEELVCNEWKFAACVIDRLCLVAFSLVTVLCTVGILMSAPSFT